MPEDQDNTLDISTIIEEVENLQEVITKEISELNTPRKIFTPVHELDPTELAGGESTLTKNLQDDGEELPLLTQPPSRYSPTVDAPDSPLPRLREDASAAAYLASKGNLP